MLSGDQVGALLADDLLANGSGGSDRLVATTIVSSSMLRRIAAFHGVQYAETLTGFKWIANRAIDHGGPFVLGYEEALGYSAGAVVRDKDGISAALLMLDLASACKARSESLWDRLLALQRRFGVHLTQQISARRSGPQGAAQIRAVTSRLRANPPAQVAGVDVVRIRDVLTGQGRDLRTGEAFDVDLPSSDVIEYVLADGGRVLARPSGTEPKIKIYVEVVAPVAEGQAVAAVIATAGMRVAEVADWMVDYTGLGD